MNPAAQFANAITDIHTIDRHITTVTEDWATHRTRCDSRCQRWRNDNDALAVLFDLRLRFMDRRTCSELELGAT